MKDKTERIEQDSEKRIINKTDLQIDKAAERGIIHRDYISHSLRWSHICKYIYKIKNRGDLNILDLGCGQEFPLLRTLYTNKIKPNFYLGCDIRKLSLDSLHEVMNPNFPHEFIQIDFANSLPKNKDEWNIISFLEVLEHNPKEIGIKILQNIRDIMSKETILFLSTPCFNGSQAGNHVYEWKYEELKEQLESLFNIENHYGTFASQSDIESHLTLEEQNVYFRLKEYYDSNFVSILMAPLYPQFSRNCIWRLKLK